MNELILNNLVLVSSLSVCAAITFIAYILNKSTAPTGNSLMIDDYNDIMNRIRTAQSYAEICDLETDIDEFDYRHNHEIQCAKLLMNLNELYSDKRHSILVDLSLQVN